MTYARDLILTITVLALIYIADNWPKPPLKYGNVDYCVIEYKAARKTQTGEYETGWARGYGPCYLQDKYHNI